MLELGADVGTLLYGLGNLPSGFLAAQPAVAQPIDECENLGHCFVDFGRNFLVEIETGKNLQKVPILPHRDIMLSREFQDLVSQIATSLGHQFRRPVFRRLVAQSYSLSWRITIRSQFLIPSR